MAEQITPYMSARPIRELFPKLSASFDATRLARCQAVIDRFFERTLLTASDGLPLSLIHI